MAELLKNRYHKAFFQQFIEISQPILPALDKEEFLRKIFCAEWEDLELKDRMRHAAVSLHSFMPASFNKSALILTEIVKLLKDNRLGHLGLEYMFLPEYIERYGMNELKASINAMEKVTTLASCEFAVRPFLIKYPEEMLFVMKRWSKSRDKDVRRLASEGSRPRLPWAIALPEFKNNPTPILPILAQLKSDSSEYVRRSVANNLNDIAKDNPEIVVSICKKWIGKTKETDALLKHGSRTLLKAGHSEIMGLFGFDSKDLLVKNFNVSTPKVSVGTKLSFNAKLKNLSEKEKMVRLEFAIYYLRKNGSHNKKVFKISEKIIKGNVEIDVFKSQSINDITTRKYYDGEQFVSLICNGLETNRLSFQLKI